LVGAVVGVTFLKVKSTEPIVITTKDFKIFQSTFLTGYSISILSEFIAVACFFHVFLHMGLNLSLITKLYVVTLVSTAGFGLFFEIIDIGAKIDKCIFSVMLFLISMLTIIFGNKHHYHLLLLGRVCYGAASALHHNSFESYIVQEHASSGYPSDWLEQTFNMLTHSMTLTASLSGMLARSAAYKSPKGCISLVVGSLLVAIIYIILAWNKDMSGPKFLLSNFSYNVSQTFATAKSNRQMIFILLVSAFSEASIAIFTFYWAPWLTSLTPESDSKPPYEIIHSVYLTIAMLGNYIYKLIYGNNTADRAMIWILMISAVLYLLGTLCHTSHLAFTASIFIQFAVGGYLPAIGAARNKYILSEMRPTAVTFSR
jgi:hypothetical protein